ncbi:MAG TPA: HemK/PrmC family methyltransferase, partial [Gemmatimonadales bacterium]|nr:HemK/PrmC family methyltransferase [Gemmatimonadales bacterium]
MIAPAGPPRPSEPGTVGAELETLTAMLASGGVEEARAEARDILAAVLDVPRLWPVANRAVPLDASVREEAQRAVARRVLGAPFAYAVGRAAFRHLTLQVDERVLIPRQETEVLVDLVLEATRDAPGGLALDVGTGSGAIALALAAEGRFDLVIGSDVSLDALAVAAANARLVAAELQCPVEFVHGAALAPFAGRRACVVVSNPPYIAPEERAALPSTVRDWEPPLALFAPDEGLAVTRAIVAAAPDVLEPGGLLA